MDSSYLVVIDTSPDHAQAINSLLRNAGLLVQVVNAPTLSKLKEVLREYSPFLVVVGAQLPESLKMSQILQATDQYSTPIALQIMPGSTGTIDAVLTERSAIMINADDNDQLVQVVKDCVASGKSVYEHDELQRKLDELQHRYDLLLDSARDSIAYIHEGLHVYANRAYLELLQVQSMDEVEGLSMLELMTTSKGTDLKNLLRDMSQDIFPEKTLAVTVRTPAGKKFKAELTFSPARFNGEQCIQMMVRQQDANLVLQEELDRLRKTDQLTQMHNRQAFTDRLSTFITEEHGTTGRSAVLYIEPDGIVNLQQELGMQGIDAYILDLANLIRGCVDDEDFTARISDHGFAALIMRDDKSGLRDTANCIIESYSSHIIDLGERTMSAACSVGIATLGSLTRDAEEIISQARIAFEKASKEGNTLATYKPALTTVSSDGSEHGWVERIRYALNNHDFYTVQQSIVDLEGESEGLFENRTFMREEEGDTPAGEFMPAADQYDLGGVIDRHIIPQLMRAIAGTGDRHIIPLSSNSVLDFSFPSWFKQQLEQTEVEGSQLILQISAIAAESNLKPTQRVIDELRNMGCGVVLSEFDSDRRRLQLLEYLSVSMVKLRPGLAEGLSGNQANQKIIRSVVNSTEPRDIIIITDEVQDASDLAVLWQCGVKLVTGDFLNEAPQVVGQ